MHGVKRRDDHVAPGFVVVLAGNPANAEQLVQDPGRDDDRAGIGEFHHHVMRARVHKDTQAQRPESGWENVNKGGQEPPAYS